MRFFSIAKHRNIWPVAWLCEALDASRSGFHAWLNRSPSARSRQDEVLVTVIDRSFRGSDRTYGARRVWHDVSTEGFSCGLHHVERLIRKNGLRARLRRRGLPKDTGERSAVSDILEAIGKPTVGVIGAGTMGGGISMAFVNGGLPVTLLQLSRDALDRGLVTGL